MKWFINAISIWRRGALIEAIDILANSTDLAGDPPDWFEVDAGSLTEEKFT